MDSLDRLANFPRGTNRFHDSALAAMLPLRNALGYVPRVEVVPDSPNIAVAPSSTYEHRVSVPPASVLWALSGSSGQADGYRVQVIDTGPNKALLSRPAQFGQITGGAPVSVKNCLGNSVSIVQPLHVLPEPRMIVEPGVLSVQVTNLSTTDSNALQLLLWLCVPPAPGEPRNDSNAVMDEEANLARRAIRGQTIVTGPDGQPLFTSATSDDPMSRPAMNAPFDATKVLGESSDGNNLIVPGALGYRIAIHELSMWSTAAADITLQGGDTPLMGTLLNFAAGFFLPYQTEPHFVLDDGQSFVIHLDSGEHVTGFVKYRMVEIWPL